MDIAVILRSHEEAQLDIPQLSPTPFSANTTGRGSAPKFRISEHRSDFLKRCKMCGLQSVERNNYQPNKDRICIGILKPPGPSVNDFTLS